MSEIDYGADIAALRDQQQKFQEGVARALGVKQDPPDPRQIAAQRDSALAAVVQRDATIREQRLEAAVLRHAGRHGGNGAALADSASFMARVSKLDPESDSFADDLGDAIRDAAQSGPRFRAGTSTAQAAAPPGRSGADYNATPAANRQWTLDDVNRLPNTAEGGRKLDEAIEAGLLRDLGVGPSRRR